MVDGLYRSRSDRVIGGLAAGMGRSLGVDVTWVRVAWVALAFVTGGVALLLYFVLLLVVPEEPAGYAPTAGTAGTGEPREDAPIDAAAADATTTTTTSWTPPPSSPLQRLGTDEGSRSGLLVVGIVLVAAGGWLLLRRYVAFDFDLGWPVIAIVLGAILVAMSLRAGRLR